MAMRGSVVRGTPYTSKTAGAEGQRAQMPGGMGERAKTSPAQYEGNQSGNRQTGIKTGTEYHSQNGNPATTRRVAQGGSPKGGIVLSENGINMNEPRSNGNGNVLDGVSEGRDYTPWTPGSVEDSPVPAGAQRPAPDSAKKLNALRNGQGKDYSEDQQIPDQILHVGGVLSRGMKGTSTKRGPETELIADDVLSGSAR